MATMKRNWFQLGLARLTAHHHHQTLRQLLRVWIHQPQLVDRLELGQSQVQSQLGTQILELFAADRLLYFEQAFEELLQNK